MLQWSGERMYENVKSACSTGEERGPAKEEETGREGAITLKMMSEKGTYGKVRKGGGGRAGGGGGGGGGEKKKTK
jgi:hypothetical protein